MVAEIVSLQGPVSHNIEVDSLAQQVLAIALADALVILFWSPRFLRNTPRYWRKGSLSQTDKYFATPQGIREIWSFRAAAMTFFTYSILQLDPARAPGTPLIAAGAALAVFFVVVLLPYPRLDR